MAQTDAGNAVSAGLQAKLDNGVLVLNLAHKRVTTAKPLTIN